jgi:hypothetical protein
VSLREWRRDPCAVPEIGEALGAAYQWQAAQPNDFMTVDMTPVLHDLPVTLTSLHEWVATNQRHFAA